MQGLEPPERNQRHAPDGQVAAPRHQARAVHAQIRDGEIACGKHTADRAENVDSVEKARERADRAIAGHEPVEQQRQRPAHEKSRDQEEHEEQREPQQKKTSVESRESRVERPIQDFDQAEQQWKKKRKDADCNLEEPVQEQRRPAAAAEVPAHYPAAETEAEEEAGQHRRKRDLARPDNQRCLVNPDKLVAQPHRSRQKEENNSQDELW